MGLSFAVVILFNGLFNLIIFCLFSALMSSVSLNVGIFNLDFKK